MSFNKVLQKHSLEIIKNYETRYSSLSNAGLLACSEELRNKLREGQFPLSTHYDDLTPQVRSLLSQAFAMVREAAFRELGYRHHKEQLMAGIALYTRHLVQMATGEGKTLAVTAPAYLAALTGQGVHIVTANDYLARRDCEAMGAIYARLGLSCAVIEAQGQFQFCWSGSDEASTPQRLQPCTRHGAYKAAITYGTASAFGFDYLRDQLVKNKEAIVQRAARAFAIVDEADNILLDEARTPLVISQKSELEVTSYYGAIELIKRLVADVDYEVEPGKHRVSFTERGITRLEGWLGWKKADSGAAFLYDGTRPELFYLTNALKALTLYHRGEDYIVKVKKPNKAVEEDGRVVVGGEVILIDSLTGRTLPGRRLAEGLHEALEAKEGLAVQSPATTVATISLHAYFRGYTNLAGLSGTLESDKTLLDRLYGLETVVIEPHHPLKRIDSPAQVFLTRQAALLALVETTLKVRASGAPILIGTASIVTSEEISALLTKQHIPHGVLNARQSADEARLIARAGYPGRVTVATNMAGRGTDIRLGGSYEDHLADLAKGRGLVREVDEGSAQWHQLVEDARLRHKRASEIVCGAGGLHVFGLGLQSSRRLQQQLSGRAGRQGDPGYSRFFYSFEDELVKEYIGESSFYQRFLKDKDKAGESEVKPDYLPDGEEFSPRGSVPTLNPTLALKLIEECQYRAEGQQIDALTHTVEFDEVLNRQRELFYSDRHAFLLAEANELKSKILQVATAGAREKGEGLSSFQLTKAYNRAETALGKEATALRVREAILWVFDRAWAEYLTPLEELRAGIDLRAYGGQKPLHSYRIEAYRLWTKFQTTTQSELLKTLLNVCHGTHLEMLDQEWDKGDG